MVLVLATALLRPALAQSAQPKTGTVRIVFVGDVMLGRAPGEAITRGEDPFAEVASVLKDADLTIGNLECAVSTVGEAVPKPVNLRAGPACIPLLQRYFSAVSLANNHTGDYGPEALVEGLTLLEKANVPYFGAGRNRKEAHRPAILQRNGLRVALLGYNDVIPPSFEAGDDRPGTAWLRPADRVQPGQLRLRLADSRAADRGLDGASDVVQVRTSRDRVLRRGHRPQRRRAPFEPQTDQIGPNNRRCPWSTEYSVLNAK